MRHFEVGSIDIAVAIHGRGLGAPDWLFPEVPAEELTEAMGPHLDVAGNIEFVFSSLVVRTNEQVVLLDTGPPTDSEARSTSIIASLREEGLTARDIDVVVISHGHDDHVGGLTTGRSPHVVAFPRATHFVAAAEFRHWTSGDEASQVASVNLATVAETAALELVDGEREVAPGVRVIPTPGHTPGHLSVVISSRGEHASYVGDVLAHQVNVPRPAWNHFSDMHPEQAIRSRRDVVRRAASGGHLVIASHVPSAGWVRRTHRGYEFSPVEDDR